MNVLISGANEGIGYYVAEQLLKEGNSVYVFDINIDSISKLNSAYPKNLHAFKCDISKFDEVIKRVSIIDCVLDVVIHNACKCTFQSFADTDLETFSSVFAVNYYGAVNMAKAAMPKMNKGKIIFVSSGVAVMGFKNISPYANSKSAIESLAKCLRIEYKDTGITFHIVHPPLTNTRSSSLLPIPKEFMQSPEKVGLGIAKRINKKSFIICHSFIQTLQTKLIYLFPLQFGSLFSKLTYEND